MIIESLETAHVRDRVSAARSSEREREREGRFWFSYVRSIDFSVRNLFAIYSYPHHCRINLVDRFRKWQSRAVHFGVHKSFFLSVFFLHFCRSDARWSGVAMAIAIRWKCCKYICVRECLPHTYTYSHGHIMIWLKRAYNNTAQNKAIKDAKQIESKRLHTQKK